jgi:hypothetical protein
VALYPTPTRLELLRAVAAGAVLDGITNDDAWLIDLDPPATKVTARMAEMDAAGWVHLDGPPVWALTDAGRTVLEDRANG